MIRSQLVDALAAENPTLSKADVEAAVAAFFDAIIERLAADGRVELRGFGAFTTRARDPRAGRNPRTGEPMTIKAASQPKFKAGKGLKDSVN